MNQQRANIETKRWAKDPLMPVSKRGGLWKTREGWACAPVDVRVCVYVRACVHCSECVPVASSWCAASWVGPCCRSLQVALRFFFFFFPQALLFSLDPLFPVAINRRLWTLCDWVMEKWSCSVDAVWCPGCCRMCGKKRANEGPCKGKKEQVVQTAAGASDEGVVCMSASVRLFSVVCAY